MFAQHGFNFTPLQQKKIRNAILKNEPCKIKISLKTMFGNDMFLITKSQSNRINNRKPFVMTVSVKQLESNKKALKEDKVGGFAFLAPLLLSAAAPLVSSIAQKVGSWISGNSGSGSLMLNGTGNGGSLMLNGTGCPTCASGGCNSCGGKLKKKLNMSKNALVQM